MATEAVRVAKAKDPWSKVRGPVGAFLCTVARLQWTVLSATVLVDDQGNRLDLLRLSPAYVRQLVDSSVRRKQARE
eukprot:6539288-Karenia_brevis.AAC.1